MELSAKTAYSPVLKHIALCALAKLRQSWTLP